MECIKLGYKKKEEDLVKDMVDVISEFNSSFFSIESHFIHGSKSMVNFRYIHGDSRPRELGDLIILTTLIDEEGLCFGKYTIIQIKKDSGGPARWNIDQKQLYLLSRFPSFHGVSGVVPKDHYFNVSNISRCLGSYGLLYSPGDFIYLSAQLLENSLCGKKSINQKVLFDRLLPRFHHLYNPFYSTYIDKLPYYLLCHHPIEEYLTVFRNHPFCPDIHNFIDNWTRFNIGEFFFSRDDNIPIDEDAVTLLRNILGYFNRDANEHGIELNLSRYFNNSSPPNKKFDFDTEGGVGLIHLSININEESLCKYKKRHLK